jgi:Diacylglycerol kinase
MGLVDKLKKLVTKKKKIVRNKDTGTPVERYFKSFGHAIDGIIYSFICEHNMIIILLAILTVTWAGIYFKISNYEWFFCIIMFGVIAATELINTSIEAVVDLVTPEYNKLAKIAKDTASSATLILVLTSVIGAIMIFLPKILDLI